ncbi:hypothetical protein [Sulfitobacter sp. D7]|uniref:hypothetical protein n=1 Tax=Sulfitobacter sp. D7 TaxID=1968541 RepID=UPI000E7775E7|nr:hypothetical protein [Sulfitobacter sp. D7]AYE85078.1 hypothetical protein B5M07_02530 [Sulfitobacter sp. D7]
MEQILKIWPTMSELAKDIDKPYSTVAAWKARGKIPADHDFVLIDAAKKRGESLTLEQLAQARRNAAPITSDAA